VDLLRHAGRFSAMSCSDRVGRSDRSHPVGVYASVSLIREWHGDCTVPRSLRGRGEAAPARVAIECPPMELHVLTIVIDRPLLSLGGSLPQGDAGGRYLFAVIELKVDANAAATGTPAPAKILENQYTFVVHNYAAKVSELASVMMPKRE